MLCQVSFLMISFQLNITEGWLIKGGADNREWQVNRCRRSWPVLRPDPGSSWTKWGKERKHQRRHPAPTRPQLTLSTATLAAPICPLQNAIGDKRLIGKNFVGNSVEFVYWRHNGILWLTEWVAAWLVSVCVWCVCVWCMCLWCVFVVWCGVWVMCVWCVCVCVCGVVCVCVCKWMFTPIMASKLQGKRFCCNFTVHKDTSSWSCL